MSLTPRDIALFARDCVAEDSRAATDEASRLRRLEQAERAARSFLAAAEASVRASGYRVTPRVREGLWSELCRIADAAERKPGITQTPPATSGDESDSEVIQPRDPPGKSEQN
jgi:hypothetical protein